jgi:hypothetical protein
VENEEETHREPIKWELSLGPDYDCYFSGGSSNNQHMTLQFVVSPRLPDNVEDMTFKFTWRRFRSPNEEGIGGEVILK